MSALTGKMLLRHDSEESGKQECSFWHVFIVDDAGVEHQPLDGLGRPMTASYKDPDRFDDIAAQARRVLEADGHTITSCAAEWDR